MTRHVLTNPKPFVTLSLAPISLSEPPKVNRKVVCSYLLEQEANFERRFKRATPILAESVSELFKLVYLPKDESEMSENLGNAG